MSEQSCRLVASEEADTSACSLGAPIKPPATSSCCPSAQRAQVSSPRMDQLFVVRATDTPAGSVPQVSGELAGADHWGEIKARWGIRRMHYMVDPGLYALGQPDDTSPVLVSANYKLSFDKLRSAMVGRDVWILVLDTSGINVWCAAGKGTFSTMELVQRIESSSLAKVVSHRRLIVPQLAAPGVAAHEVKKHSGFKVIYGPIRAVDLPAFIDAGLKATPEMRLKAFPLWERIVLIPVELVEAFKWTLLIACIFFFLGGLGAAGGYWAGVLNHGLFAVWALFSAVLAGAVLTPILLPWLPGRAFALKGMVVGLVVVAALIVARGADLAHWPARLEMLAWAFLIPSFAAYLAMNFTGASTYTSLSGVKKEMRWAVPIQIAGACVGLVLWFGSRFTA